MDLWSEKFDAIDLEKRDTENEIPKWVAVGKDAEENGAREEDGERRRKKGRRGLGKKIIFIS